jgi:hypothetical protein
MIDDDELRDLGARLSFERFARGDKSIANTFGRENTARGRAVADACLPTLTRAVAAYVPHGGRRGALRAVLGQLAPERIATAILSGAIRSIGLMSDIEDDDDDRDVTLGATRELIGRNLERECRSARLLRQNASGYWRIDWEPRLVDYAGGWGVDVLVTTLPDMFEVVGFRATGMQARRATIFTCNSSSGPRTSATKRCGGAFGMIRTICRRSTRPSRGLRITGTAHGASARTLCGVGAILRSWTRFRRPFLGRGLARSTAWNRSPIWSTT